MQEVGGSIPPSSTTDSIGPHRLEAKDSALSRRQQGFESPWGRQQSKKGRPSACPFYFVRPKGSMRTPGSTNVSGTNFDAEGARRAAGRTARRQSPPRRSLPFNALWRPAFCSGSAARPREGTAQCHYLVAGGSVSFPSNRAAKMTPSESDSPDPLQRRRISASWALS